MVRTVREEETIPRGARTKVVASGDPSIQGLTSEILRVQMPMETLPQTSKQLFRPCVPEVTGMRGKLQCSQFEGLGPCPLTLRHVSSDSPFSTKPHLLHL